VTARMKIEPTSPILWLILSVTAGIVYLMISGAPLHYPAINAIALGLGLALIRFMPWPKSDNTNTALAAAAVFALFLPLLIGPELGGIRRWIGLGPFQLHSGMMVLPMLVTLLPHLKPRQRIYMIAAACIAISIQPDRASAVALLAGTSAILLADKSVSNALPTICAFGAVCTTLIQPDSLEAVRFVERVIIDAWQDSPLVASLLAATLLATLIIPGLRSRSLIAASAVMAGFAIASLLGVYPVPFIGYGASSVLGFSLAVAANRRLEKYLLCRESP
jgi:hypothetical protein